MSFSVRIEMDGFERVTETFENALYDGCVRGVSAAIREGAGEARRTHRFKNRTGAAERCIKSQMLTSNLLGAEGEIVCDVPYAKFLSDGTRPHVIEGNPYLHFVWKGVPMTLRRVHHPGTKADPFMGNAYLKAERVLYREIEIAAARAAELVHRAAA